MLEGNKKRGYGFRTARAVLWETARKAAEKTWALFIVLYFAGAAACVGSGIWQLASRAGM